MKTKIISLLFFFSVVTFFANGQENRKFNLEEFKKNRSEFLKKEIGLTKEEEKKFIPISDELMKKKYDLNRQLRQESRTLRSKEKMTDADYEAIVKKTLETKAKEVELEKEYYEKFKKVLSPEKIYKYQMAEMKLAKNMVHNRERPNANRK